MLNDPYIIASKAQAKAIRLRKRKLKHQQNLSDSKLHLELKHGSNTQIQGKSAEDKACIYLKNQGLKVLGRNLLCRMGEIDILAIDNKTIVFIEVRQRSNNLYGGAAASIGKQKQHKIILTANYFLPRIYNYIGHKMVCRFDVIVINNNKLSWFKNAFNTQ